MKSVSALTMVRTASLFSSGTSQAGSQTCTCTLRLKRISPHVQVVTQFTFIIINHHPRVFRAS